ncbi:MAG: hypothetical protein KJ963_02155 [Bacteroidetes bacterium]|nr:hypothetical protein [Bacteroidota bacterium]
MRMFFIFATVITFTTHFIALAQPGGREILNRVEDRFNEIKDYTADVLTTIEMERLRIPRKKIKIYFKQPDKFHLESDGFAMIPREGFGFNPSQFQADRYDAVLIGMDTVNGSTTFKLQLAAKVRPLRIELRLRQIFLWVDSQNWVIRKMESIAFENRLVKVTFDYGLVEKKYLLPSNIVVQLSSPSTEKENDTESRGMDGMRRRIPRSGTITITFTKYSVNQNLPDTLFEKEK